MELLIPVIAALIAVIGAVTDTKPTKRSSKHRKDIFFAYGVIALLWVALTGVTISQLGEDGQPPAEYQRESAQLEPVNGQVIGQSTAHNSDEDAKAILTGLTKAINRLREGSETNPITAQNDAIGVLEKIATKYKNTPGIHSMIATMKEYILSTKSIEVLYPNGGEIWNREAPYEIKWASRGINGNVKIQLRLVDLENSGWWITESTPNTGHFTYKGVPKSYSYEDFKIRIMTLDDSVIDESDQAFTSPPLEE